jgi:hypothetical protein
MKSVKLFQCIALLASSSSAAAQFAPGNGQSGTSTERIYTGRQVYDDLSDFGGCFATRQSKDALKLLGTQPGSTDEARVYKELFSKDQPCLTDLNGLSVQWQYVRGAVGEGFYARKVALPPAYAAPHSLPPQKVQSVMDAAICYADKNAPEARSLIETTKPETKEESAAIDALWPHFEACLPPNIPAGYKFDQHLLRYRIAEALWRLGWVHS